MKKTLLIALSLFFVVNLTAQKLKGNKNVTLEHREVGDFHSVLVKGKIQVFVSPSTSNKVMVETDENLHEAVVTEVVDGVLEIYLLQKITRKKLLEININVTDSIQRLETQDRSKLIGITEIRGQDLLLVANDNSLIEMSLNTSNISLSGSDRGVFKLILSNEQNLDIALDGHSYAELQATTEKVNIKSTEDTTLKIEGSSTDMVISAKDNAEIRAKGLLVDYASVKASDKSSTTVNVAKELSISAENKSKVYVYDNPTFFLDKFVDRATLYKKQ